VGEEFDLLPVLGAYKETVSENLPVRTLVYPVPHPVNPFLGVHLTPTLKGTVKIGPTAFPTLGPEQYTFFSKMQIGEFLKSTKSFMNFVQNQKGITREIMKTEIPYLKLNNILRDLSQMIPTANGSTGWKTLKPGIRGQLIEKSTGKFVNDFIVREASNSMHVLNIVSPGFTSSLSFGRYIASSAVAAREKGNY
jgi:L-2-hydroxyglutarate oxidase LhgO